MPWSPKEFKARHNHKLTPEQARKASKIANAMLREGEPEGVAIATANKMAQGKKRSSSDRAASRYGR